MPRQMQASAEVEAPIAVVYERASAFELYPEFVPGLVAVHRVSPRRLRMVADVGDSRHEWSLRFVEQRRQRSVAIALEDRFPATARVHLHPTSETTTDVKLTVEYELDLVRERLLTLVFDPQPQLEAGLGRFRDWVHSGESARVTPRARRAAGA